MASLRIAFDARYINDRYHGIGRYAFSLLEALAAVAPEYSFVVFRGRDQDSRFDWEALEKHPNVEFRAGPWPLYWPHEQLLWPRLLGQVQADLFHTPYFVVPFLTTIPVLNTIHDLIFDRYPSYMPQAWSRPYYRLLMRWGTRRARRIITVSQHSATDLALYYRTPLHKVAVIPEAVAPTFAPVCDPQRLRACRQRYGLSRRFILTVGAHRPHKNLRRLVRAFATLAGTIEHDLVFVGPSDSRFPDDAQKAAECCGLNGRTRFLDWVDEGDLPSLYTLADLLVMPSFIEGFGLPALEAMACGTPVVAANNSSLPEVIGAAGILVNPHDVDSIAAGIQRLLEDEASRRHLGNLARERARTFSWRRAAHATLALYHEVGPQ